MVRVNPNTAMFHKALSRAFSNRHVITKSKEGIFYISQGNKRLTHLRAFSYSESEDVPLDELKGKIRWFVEEHTRRGLYTGFVFLRCETDYEVQRNLNQGFLKQAGIKRTPRSVDQGLDYYNIKRLTKLELAVLDLYDVGKDKNGFGSRCVYFNPKTGFFESVIFSEDIPELASKGCDGYCTRYAHHLPDDHDYSLCKEKGCTRYAWGREYRMIDVSCLRSPLRIVPETKVKDNLAKIVGARK